jgi:hypothetical protein
MVVMLNIKNKDCMTYSSSLYKGKGKKFDWKSANP